MFPVKHGFDFSRFINYLCFEQARDDEGCVLAALFVLALITTLNQILFSEAPAERAYWESLRFH